MSAHRLLVRLELEGPILTSATNPGALGIDTPFARMRDHKLYFPGTLVKGKLLQAWRELDGWDGVFPNSTESGTWLGSKTGNARTEAERTHSFDPSRGRAYFSDFVDASSAGRTALRTRIKMDEARGAADDGMMQISESPYASGERATFEGTIDFWEKGTGELRRFTEAVRLGLSAVPSFGAERGIGFGRLCSVNVTEAPNRQASASSASLPAGVSAGLVLSTMDLLCLAQPQASANLFQSSDIIPGSAIKGAIAQMKDHAGVNAFPLLERYLSRIRIRHARPVGSDGQGEIPPAIPFSVVFTGKQWKDAVHCQQAVAVDRQAPSFQPDWKDADWGTAGDSFGVKRPDRELRVRTAIDGPKRRALDENLFAYEAVVPDGYRWVSAIDLYEVPQGDRQPLWVEIQGLLSGGLFGIGKTKALMTVALGGTPSPKFGSAGLSDASLTVQLQTPALLGTPTEWQVARTADDVLQIYRTAWAELSHNRLELSHYFARQELAGGWYLHRRFRKGLPYQPWLLTSAGSVFVFRGIQPGAGEHLQEWLERGLPIDDRLVEPNQLGGDRFRYWERCPYVPENGYGEIGVNLHLNWKDHLLEERNA